MVDESYLQYSSRNSLSADGRTVRGLINLSRQKRQTLIFVAQSGRQIDVDIASQVDVLAVKEMSELSVGYERPQLERFLDKAAAALRDSAGNAKAKTWCRSEAADFEGVVMNELPTFWKPSLSTVFAMAGEPAKKPREGQRRPARDMKPEALAMRGSGWSYQQIADNLGVSKATAWRLINQTQDAT